jgi:hypothetical protein
MTLSERLREMGGTAGQLADEAYELELDRDRARCKLGDVAALIRRSHGADAGNVLGGVKFVLSIGTKEKS